jgi:hypothetical protein
MDQQRLVADEVVTSCTLRFDGHKYVEVTGFDVKAGIDAYMKTEAWDRPDEEKLAIFYILQRCLCKWSLVYEPQHGRYWRLFREMFFDVVELEIPQAYNNNEWLSRWNERYASQRDKAIACVRRKHQRTKYDDNARPDFG